MAGIRRPRPQLAWAEEILDRFGALLAELAARSTRGELTQSYPQLLHSFSHLNAVRLLRSAARTHELILLSFLDRPIARPQCERVDFMGFSQRRIVMQRLLSRLFRSRK